MRTSPVARLPALVRETGGAIFVEYVTLLVLVALVAGSAMVVCGIPLIRLYRYMQMVIAVPFP